MSSTPAPTFGRALGEAARQMTKLHHRALSDLDADFPRWMLYTLLTEKGGPLPAAEVAAELDRRADLGEADVRSVLARAVADGHVTDDPTVGIALTEAGSGRFAEMYTHSRAVTDATVEGIDPEMVATAVKVLVAAGERAARLA